jgi:hypothetical protein
LEGRTYRQIAGFKIRMTGTAHNLAGGMNAANSLELPKLIVGIKDLLHINGAENTVIL